MINYRISSSVGRPSLCLASGRLLALSFAALLASTAAALAAPGDIGTIAGTGSPGDAGDAGPAVAALLANPARLARDSSGVLYVADAGNDKVRRIALDGTITTFAGTGVAGYGGDSGPATAALLKNPLGVAVGADGTVFIADTGNDRVRRVATDGTITTHAGTGTGGSAGDGGPATAARLNAPYGLAVGLDGSLFIADRSNNKIRKVDAGGTITTFAGVGPSGFTGDDGPATAARLNHPTGVAVSATNEVYIADFGNHRIRKVDSSGIITTYAGVGSGGYTGDGGPATAAKLAGPSDVALAATGILFIADSNNDAVRAIDPDGTIDTFAGTGIAGYTGDGGPATAARLKSPTGVALAFDGSLLIADELNHAIRHVESKCGDATVDVGEACDLGAANGTPGVCCASDCSLRLAGDVCRASSDLCDPAETCDGATTICPADAIATAGTVCRAVADVCDVAETCNGTSTACPVDGFVDAGTLCRGVAGPCDVAESCTGASNACPADAKRPEGEICLASTGPCDPAETCDGATNACPADVYSPAGTTCREAAGLCDLAESCDGVSVTCPADDKVAAGTTCRESTGICDPAESCDGSSNACPTDISSSDDDADDTCDHEDNCVGIANAGQEDGDADGVGDVCDNCVTTCNPDQTDSDSDLAGGDACDACPAFDQAGQAPECASADLASALACCLPAGSGARPVDAEGDACTLGGTASLASVDGTNRARIAVGAAIEPTSVSVTGLTRGVLSVDPDAVQVAATALFTPEAMTFAAPLTVCMGWPDGDDDDVADGSGLAAADLRPALVGAGDQASVIAGRCQDQPCGALDGGGFPTSYGAAGVRSDDPSLGACCSLEDKAWCFESTSLGRYALLDTPCLAASDVRVQINSLSKPAGKQTLLVDGEVELGHPFDPPLNPAVNGLVVSLVGASGATLFEARVPPGFYDTLTREGWSSTSAGTSARWRSKTTVKGIHLVKLSWSDRRNPGVVSFQIKGKKMSLPVPPSEVPITARVRFDDPAEVTGQCAALAFPGPPVGIGCLITSGGTRLLCQ